MASALVFKLHERGPQVVRDVLLERGWVEHSRRQQRDRDWNLYWRSTAFRSSDYSDLYPWQRLNHHPQSLGITRKDNLARNLRRMRGTFGSTLYNFSPVSFILPNDYTRFLAEHERLRQTHGECVYWICKPVDLSRGRGIFIFHSLKDLIYDCSVIVQRYISDPLLISGYKFDLRIYVCVKNFNPLTVYIHQEGLVRFATEKYDLLSLRNLFAHLTNTSINKTGPFYQSQKGRVGRGCKWTMGEFRHFLHREDVEELLLWQKINNIVTLTLLTIASSVPNCPNCVELFGFDVLIDAGFEPWLLEVNYSPALRLDCQVDIKVKKILINDLIDLMSYTLTDSLRDRRTGSSSKDPRNSSSLPRLHTFPSEVRTSRSRPRSLGDAFQKRLPPLRLDRAGDKDATVAGPKTGQSQNLICGQHPGRDMPAHKTRGFTLNSPSEADKLDDPLTPRTLKSRRCSKKPSFMKMKRGRTAGTMPVKAQDVPPARVGDFIRTFPFNKATLNASRHNLDVKAVVNEIQRLTARLASGGRVKGKIQRREKDCDSLCWGPQDPPLLSQLLH